MEKTTLQVGTYQVNCTMLAEGATAWIVDPGGEAERIVGVLREKGWTPAGILLTHAHFDHIGGIPDLQRAFPDLPVWVGAADVPAFTHPMNVCPPDYPAIARPKNIRPIETATLDLSPTWRVAVLPTPGHTPGGVCYYFADDRLLLSGDTLFAGSVGRTDFPGGDMAALMTSLASLKPLPPDTTVIPGHGFFTTLGREFESNPFLFG